jgi:branched-chain amino acid aminotransferase
MAKWVFLNNGFIEDEKAFLHFKDLVFQRGYGLFDFFRLVGNQPLFMEDHLHRFYSSAEAMHLKMPFSKAEMTGLIQRLIERNNLPHTGIRLGLTGGYSPDGFNTATPNLVISQSNFSLPLKEHSENGLKLVSYQHVRQLPHIKTIDYLMPVWLQPFLKEKGADDVLYHQNGIISECARNNFFIITKDDKIITPDKNILFGITRKKLLELASKEFEIEETTVTLDEIKEAKEAFITGTIKQVLPIAQIDDLTFSQTKISKHLLQLFLSTYY